MTQISRRQFLQLAGITVLGHSVGFEGTDPLESYYGRALEAAPVFRQPRPDAAQVTSLWPDSVVAITPAKGRWYHASGGYVPRAFLQPMRHQPSYSVQWPASLPFWAEVRAPVAVIRQWCAPEASLVTRIGYGGVMQVVDYLPGAIDWFGVANADGTFIGWSQALHWQPITARWQPLSALNIEIDQGQRKIRIFQQGKALMQAQYAAGRDLPPGQYTVRAGYPGGIGSGDQRGAGWQLRIAEAFTLMGIYWHNRFGGSLPGPDIQVTPLLARWLYEHVDTSTNVRVHA